MMKRMINRVLFFWTWSDCSERNDSRWTGFAEKASVEIEDRKKALIVCIMDNSNGLCIDIGLYSINTFSGISFLSSEKHVILSRI